MILIIGYGNPMRGDDAIGWVAAQTLGDENQDANVEVIGCHQLTPEFAEALSRAQTAIFIDAGATLAAGEVLTEDVKPIEAVPGSMTHHVTPGVLLTMAEVLFGSRPQAHAISIGCVTFECGAALYPEVSAALPVIKERVREIIRQNADYARLTTE